jgi:colicin import membrane protein
MRRKIVTKRAERIPEEDLASATVQDGAEHTPDETATSELDTPEDQQTSDDTLDYTRLADQVASVLAAVEVAAGGIREEARTGAERLLEDARQEAATTLHEATELRSAAEEASKLTRESAEAYAEDRRQKAEAEASRVLDAAQQEAALRVEGRDERQRALEEGIQLSEARLHEVTVGLRTLTTLIEKLLQTDGVPVQGTEPEAGEPEETLDESLKASLPIQDSSHGMS